MIDQEIIALSCARGGSFWIIGKIYSQKKWRGIGLSCPGRCGVSVPGGFEEKGRWHTDMV